MGRYVYRSHHGDPVENWRHLWIATGAIRETVEFGGADEGGYDAMGLQFSGGRLMRLAFGIGLMMLNVLADQNFAINLDRQNVLSELFGDLAAAAFEMRSIDHFDQGYWDVAVQHLAVRRLLWATRADSVAAHFRESTKPKFVDFLIDAETEVEYLFALIETCLRNGVTHTVIRGELDKAGIDLANRIVLAERLRGLSARRSGVDDMQLEAVRSVVTSDLGDPPTDMPS